MRWRPMRPDDLAAVEEMAGMIHESHPEDAAVFAERLALHPAGCLILESVRESVGEPAGEPGVIGDAETSAMSATGVTAAGYALTHPWLYGMPPALDTMLGAIPAGADCYHIHDIALLQTARGSGAASAAVRAVLDHARTIGLARATLVAVNDTLPFWQRHGFQIDESPALAAKLATYAGAARHMSRIL